MKQCARTLSSPERSIGVTPQHRRMPNTCGRCRNCEAGSRIAGAWKWRLKSNYPIVSGLTATAGGLMLFGDVDGNFHALDASNGQKLWSQELGGAIGGGVITYTVGADQKIAAAIGFTHPVWPTKIVTAVAAAVRLRHQLSHHLPSLHDWACGVAHHARRRKPVDRQRALSAGLRFLAEVVRPLIRHGGRQRDRHGISVRHQLECVAGARSYLAMEDHDGRNSAVVWENTAPSAESRPLRWKREPQWK
jgi:hypothetical protein